MQWIYIHIKETRTLHSKISYTLNQKFRLIVEIRQISVGFFKE